MRLRFTTVRVSLLDLQQTQFTHIYCSNKLVRHSTVSSTPDRCLSSRPACTPRYERPWGAIVSSGPRAPLELRSSLFGAPSTGPGTGATGEPIWRVGATRPTPQVGPLARHVQRVLPGMCGKAHRVDGDGREEGKQTTVHRRSRAPQEKPSKMD